jgi:hypothetical protein
MDLCLIASGWTGKPKNRAAGFALSLPSVTLQPPCPAPLPSPTRIDTFGPSVKSFFREFFQLCRHEKKWWLIPLVVLLLLALAAIFILASNSGISWALYPAK